MAHATLPDCQVPLEFQGEALRRVEALRALVAQGERLALHEARICGPRLRAVTRWQRVSAVLLGLALLGLPLDFFFGANGIALAALVAGIGGHFTAEWRIDALIEARERLFESEKQALSLQWRGLGITEPPIASLAAYVPEVRSAYGWSRPGPVGHDMTLQSFIAQAEASMVDRLRSAA